MDDVERTLPASERRRAWAREQGYSPRSAAFTAAVSLGAAAALWLTAGPGLIDHLAARLQTQLTTAPAPTLGIDSATALIRDAVVSLGLMAVWGLAVIWGAAVIANLVQTGFRWSPAALAPDASRTNPISGLSRLFSMENVATAVWSLVMLATVTVSAVVALRSFALQESAWDGPVAELVRRGNDGLAMTALQLAGVVVAICVLDVVRRRWSHEQSLRMTAEEMREETGKTPVTRQRSAR